MRFPFFKLRDLLRKHPENEVGSLLKTFSCPKEPDVESFLHCRAIEFEKRYLSRTYLWVDLNFPGVVAYFSLALKSLEINLKDVFLSNTQMREVFYGYLPSEEEIKQEIYKSLPVYLVGQIGRHKEVGSNDLPGKYILDTAKSEIKEGMF